MGHSVCSAATFQNAAKTKLESSLDAQTEFNWPSKLESSLDVQTRIQFGRPNWIQLDVQTKDILKNSSSPSFSFSSAMYTSLAFDGVYESWNNWKYLSTVSFETPRKLQAFVVWISWLWTYSIFIFNAKHSIPSSFWQSYSLYVKKAGQLVDFPDWRDFLPSFVLRFREQLNLEECPLFPTETHFRPNPCCLFWIWQKTDSILSSIEKTVFAILALLAIESESLLGVQHKVELFVQ